MLVHTFVCCFLPFNCKKIKVLIVANPWKYSFRYNDDFQILSEEIRIPSYLSLALLDDRGLSWAAAASSFPLQFIMPLHLLPIWPWQTLEFSILSCIKTSGLMKCGSFAQLLRVCLWWTKDHRFSGWMGHLVVPVIYLSTKWK